MKISFTLITLLLLSTSICSFAQSYPELKTNLYVINQQGSPDLIDGNLVIYNEAYSNAVDAYDAPKMTNFGENIAMERETKTLAVEKRQLIEKTDTVFFKIWRMRQETYQLTFFTKYLEQEGRKGFLEDNYLKTKTEIALNNITTANFIINTDPASADAHRFRIIITRPAIEPVIFTKADGNRKNDGVELIWNVADLKNIRQFEIEKSGFDNRFLLAKTITPDTNAQAIFSWIDDKATTDLTTYRISSVNVDGKIEYSNPIVIAKVERHYTAAVFPNPVKNGIININVQGIASANYNYKIISMGGQLSQAGEVTLSSQTGSIKLSGNVLPGNYRLLISKEAKMILNQGIVVQ